MWYRTDWDMSKYHPICSGNLWVNPTAGVMAYYNTALSKYVISAMLPYITVTGAISTNLVLVAGRQWNYYHIFADSGGDLSAATHILWACILSGCLGGANTTLDSWWSVSGYSGTGSKQGAATADVTLAWADYPRWESATQAGEYAAAGSASGVKCFGMRVLGCAPVANLTEALTFKDGKPTFKNAAGWIIQYDNSLGKWTLTLSGSKAVYWACSTLLGSYARVTSLTDEELTAKGSPYTQTSIAVAVDSWTLPTTTAPIYMCEVSHFLTGSN